ncbi:anti-sigma factor family protein [Luteimonas saliphila]|uniref:anti-sigma factor family protein n=1 Tax=Luteimonas saliphila TaxID=2804919 RepID=UPI001EE25D8B|nr:anti-sigma factor [Luteimonas saliphila]
MNIDAMHHRPDDSELHAYVDGRLDPARHADVEAWLAAHPQHAARVADWKRDAERLRALHAHPEHWASNIALDPAHVRNRLRSRRRARLGIAAALLLAFGMGSGAGWQARESRPVQASLPMADALAAYRQFVNADAPPMEFDASRSDDLQRWLRRHFGEAGRVPDLSAAGYRLMGGRLLSTEQGVAAMLVYQEGSGARVGFYLRPRGLLRGDGQRRDGDLLARYWSKRDTSFALVSATEDAAALKLPGLFLDGR